MENEIELPSLSGESSSSNTASTIHFAGGGSLSEISCDLFTRHESLCHCVSQDLAMSKGIAVRFRDQFGRIDELQTQKPTVGGVCILNYEHGFVYYLITKVRYSHKPTYDSLTASLQAVASHMVANHVQSLSMPLIGCGLDGLEWPKVRNILANIFGNTAIKITVCVFTPQGSANGQRRKFRKK